MALLKPLKVLLIVAPQQLENWVGPRDQPTPLLVPVAVAPAVFNALREVTSKLVGIANADWIPKALVRNMVAVARRSSFFMVVPGPAKDAIVTE